MPNAKRCCVYKESKPHTHAKTHTFGTTVEETLEMVPSGGLPAKAEDNVGVFFTFKHHTQTHTNIHIHTVQYITQSKWERSYKLFCRVHSEIKYQRSLVDHTAMQLNTIPLGIL